MVMILHYLVRSIRENKFRTFIILLSVCLSGALLFASLAMTGTLEKMVVDRVRSEMGTADIQITAEKKAADRLVRKTSLGELEGRVLFQTGIYSTGGTVRNPDDQNKRINLRVDGIAKEDLQRMTPVHLMQGTFENYQGYALILGQTDAQKLKVKLGDLLTIRMNNRETKFRIIGIGESTGALRPSSGNNIRVFVPVAHLQKLNGAEGRFTHVLVRAASGEDVPKLTEDLKSIYKRQDVRPVITQEELRRATDETVTALYIMLSLVVVMSVFIIYTAFKVIAFEKLPVIGTLRSVGASKRMTDAILFLESAAYGVVGGLAGLGLGLVILQVFAAMLAENPDGGAPLTVELVYGPEHFVVSLVFSIVMALIGSAMPIFSVSKLPVKSIILNQLETGKQKKDRLWPGAVLIITSVTAAWFIRGDMAILVDVAALAVVCTGLIMMMPALSDLSIRCMAGLYRRVFGNIGVLAARNVKGNRNMINNISLLMLGISGIIMINTISSSVGIEVMNAFKRADFEVMFSYEKIDRQYESRVKGVEGVSGVYGFYNESDVPIKDKNYTLRSVQGIESTYFDYWDYPFDGDRASALKALDADKAILLTVGMRDALNLKLGDVIELQLPKGIRAYRIAGFVNTMENEGSLAFLPARYMKTDFEKRYKDTLFVRTTDTPEVVKARLEKAFARDKAWVQTIGQMTEEEINNSGQMFVVLQCFSVLTMVIGLFGILNNVLVSIMSRRRQFAVLRSMGLSRRQMIQLILAEATFSGTTGGLAGCVGGFLFCVLSGFILRSMNIDMALHYKISYDILGLVGAISITVLASLKPAISSSKQSIIEAVKFE